MSMVFVGRKAKRSIMRSAELGKGRKSLLGYEDFDWILCSCGLVFRFGKPMTIGGDHSETLLINLNFGSGKRIARRFVGDRENCRSDHARERAGGNLNGTFARFGKLREGLELWGYEFK